jgi:hypothetical protein
VRARCPRGPNAATYGHAAALKARSQLCYGYRTFDRFARFRSTRDPIADRNRMKLLHSQACCLIARLSGRAARVAVAIGQPRTVTAAV